jgi:hypothetical protein
MGHWEARAMNDATPETPAVPIETTIESILQAAWPMPLWQVVVTVLLFGLFAVWIYITERGRAGRPLRLLLASLRFALLLLVLWMLAGWSWLRFKSDPPELVIVVDRSTSMDTRDGGEGDESPRPTRLARGLQIFESLGARRRDALSDQYQLVWYTLSDALELVSVDISSQEAWMDTIQADGEQSRLGDGLVRVLERQVGSGTAAIIFLSDGINTSGASLQEAALAARRMAVPVHVVAIGRQFELPDLRLTEALVDREVYLGDQVVAEVSLVTTDVPRTQTRVLLKDRSTDKVLNEEVVTLAAPQNQTKVRLSFIPDRAGEIPLRIEVIPLAGESDLANNIHDTLVNVQDKKIRVLLVHEVPSYEFRFLKSFLQRAQQADGSSASFELQTILQDSDPEYVEEDSSALRLVPSSPERVKEYDVFLLGDVDPQLISQSAQQAIYEAVTAHGAGCMFICGWYSPDHKLAGWPLEKLLPLERSSENWSAPLLPLSGSFQWQPSTLGTTALPMQLASSSKESLDIWERLPHLHTLCRIPSPLVGAQVIANAVSIDDSQSLPLLVTQFAGAGRVALQATDETYRWTSFHGTDLYYQRYWGQMIRWLSRGKLKAANDSAELTVDPKQAKLGQPVRFQLTLGSAPTPTSGQADAVDLIIESEQGRRETLNLVRADRLSSVYQGTALDLSPGTYRAFPRQIGKETVPSVEFVVNLPPGEQSRLRVDLEGLRYLAEQSRGKFYTESNAARLLEHLPPGKPTRLGTLPPIPAWNSPWLALLFVALLTLEWVLRRRYHML